MAKRPNVTLDQIRSGFKAIFDLMYHKEPVLSSKVKNTFAVSAGINNTSVAYKKFMPFLNATDYVIWHKRMSDKLYIDKFWDYDIVSREYYHYLTGIVLPTPKTYQELTKSVAPTSEPSFTEVDGGGKSIHAGTKVYLLKDNRCRVGTYHGYYLKDGIHKVMVDEEWRDVSEVFRSKNDFDTYVLSMLDQVRISRNES